MKKNALKVFSASVALTMMLGMTSCSNIQDLLGGKDGKKGDSDEAVEEVEALMTEYMDDVVKGKFDKAAKLVDGGESLFDELALTVEQEEYLDVLTSNTEYEIADVDAKAEKSGSCTVTITTVDLEAYYNDEDDTVEEEFSIKFTYDDGWLIKDASDIESFYIDTVINAEISGFNADAAYDYLTALLDDMTSGDTEAAFKLTRTETSTYTDYDEFIENSPESAVDLFVALFDNSSYTAEISETGDDYIMVDVNLVSPDPAVAFDEAVEDYIPVVFAYSLFDSENEEAINQLQLDLVDSVIDKVATTSATMDSPVTYKVTLDENGEFTHELIGEFALANVDMNMNSDNIFADRNQEDYILPACDYALENGLCTQEEYDAVIEYMNNGGEADNSGLIGDYVEYSSTIIYAEGSDFFSIDFCQDYDETNIVTEYNAGDTGIFIAAETYSYNDAGSIASADFYYEGEYVISNAYVAPDDYHYEMYFSYDPEGGLEAGEYTVYITGYDGNDFAVVAILVE